MTVIIGDKNKTLFFFWKVHCIIFSRNFGFINFLFGWAIAGQPSVNTEAVHLFYLGFEGFSDQSVLLDSVETLEF